MGSLSQQTDVVVIGGGPGGYVAALRAADLGKEVILDEERPRRGGVCLLEGCIPSKTLIHSAEIAEAARRSKNFGVVSGEVSINLKALRANKEKVVTILSRGVDQLLKARGVEVIQARARFEGPRKLQLVGADVAGIEFRHAKWSRPWKWSVISRLGPGFPSTSTTCCAPCLVIPTR
ncbi:MAG: FAD-dependent oxidoreductase [Acidobacteriota bacterium]|nr:FAD-dependent oxidoreductase [Acidobacteriota bacterium]